MTKVEATTSDQNSEDKTLEGEQDKNGENRETPAKQPEKPENVVDTKKERKVQKSMKALRKEYYEFALPLWQKTTPFPDIPPQNDHRLRDPNIWRFNNNNVFESKEEWADKHHPGWESHRQNTYDDRQIGAYIHHVWDWKSSVDITRNLTKFSSKRRNLPASSQDDTSQSSSSNSAQEGTDKSNCSSNAEDDKRAKKPELAGCNFCTKYCHCSPGRRLKRPYHATIVNDREVVVEDKGVSYEKKMRLADVDSEIRDTLNTQIQQKPLGNRNRNFEIDYFTKSATNLMGSSNEIFEMMAHYRKDVTEAPNLTQEQVRELICVETTQDKYRDIYKSPYGGEGHSESEEDESDDDDEEESDDEGKDEKKKQENKVQKEQKVKQNNWSRNQLENY